MTKFVQISDCHIGHSQNNKNLLKIVKKIQHLAIKYLIISGDLTVNGLLSEYLQLQIILDILSNTNIFVLAGNHDNIANMAKIFSIKQQCNFVIGSYNIQLINSKIANKVSGRIDINAIDKELVNSILITHHPVINMQSTWDDSLSIDNQDEFLQIIANNKNIKAVCFGHSHEAKDFNYQNIDLYSCPSTAYQFNDNDKIGFNLYEIDKSIKKTTIWIDN